MDKNELPQSACAPPSDAARKAITRRRDKLYFAASLRALLLKIAVIAALVWAVFSFVFGLGIASGQGMYPALRDGDLLLYYRLDTDYAIEEIVTFRVDGARHYGRVVARGGDTVDISANGQLLVNGNPQQEVIFYPTSKEGKNDTLPRTLADWEIYVLGDRRTSTVDSRDFGPLRIDEIDGTVIALLRRRGL